MCWFQIDLNCVVIKNFAINLYQGVLFTLAYTVTAISWPPSFISQLFHNFFTLAILNRAALFFTARLFWVDLHLRPHNIYTLWVLLSHINPLTVRESCNHHWHSWICSYCTCTHAFYTYKLAKDYYLISKGYGMFARHNVHNCRKWIYTLKHQ